MLWTCHEQLVLHGIECHELNCLYEIVQQSRIIYEDLYYIHVYEVILRKPEVQQDCTDRPE